MKNRLLHQVDGKRTFAVVLQTGDKAMACLKQFADDEKLGGAQGWRPMASGI